MKGSLGEWRSFARNGYQEQKYPSKARFVFAMGMATPALSSLKVNCWALPAFEHKRCNFCGVDF